MSDRPRDQESDAADAGRDVSGPRGSDPADEPVTGAPAGASVSPAAPSRPAASAPSSPAPSPAPSPAAGRATGTKERRRRRWFVAGIVAGAALIVIALCAGTFAVVSAIDGVQDRNEEVREARRLRDGECLGLEQRLNRLLPPGATTTPQARAVAIRDENSAVRIYVNQIRHPSDQDGWRQLLDARTAYAEALDLQAKSRTPAFYVPPRATDGAAVTDELVDWAPEPCAGPIRRLAVPDL